MKNAKLDVSAWNLAMPMVVLAACGPVVAVDGDTDGETGTHTESDTILSATTTTIDPGECRSYADCPGGYDCVDGQCIYSGCDDCCEGECGWYGECYVDEDCARGEVCEFNYCQPGPGPQECNGLALAAAIPVLEGDEPIVAIAFVEALPSAGRELAVATATHIEVLAAGGPSTQLDVPDVAELAAADLDADGDDDLVLVVGGTMPLVRTMLGDGVGGFVDGASLPIAATQIVFGDFDVDGTIDLATGGAVGVVVHHGLGNGGFEGDTSLSDTPTIDIVAVPSTEGTDLVFYTDDTMWYLAAWQGFSGEPLGPAISFAGARALTAGDYDDNGYPDATAIDIGTGSPVIQTWHDLATLTSALAWTPPRNFSLVTSGDLDSDGHAELVLAAQSGDLAVRFGTQATRASDPLDCYVLGTTAEWVNRIVVGDFDGDGRGDVIATADTTVMMTRY